MIAILFVDDEINVLDGLRRMLRPMRLDWQMKFVESGREALIALSEKSYDVIVSDMRMPEMDGVELLTEVMRKYPHTIRLALSGHAKIEKILESARVAHQYLAKPTDAKNLIDTVKRACSLRSLFNNSELESVLAGIDKLPSLPKFYTELMDEIADPNSDINRVAEVICKDVSMSTKIMQVVNSAFFGMKQHVSSPAQAVSILGIDTIKGLAITTQAFSVFDASAYSFDMEALWSHSGRVAVLAAQIAEYESDDNKISDYAFVAGLLHDIGKLVFATQLSDHYQRFVSSWDGNKLNEVAVEREIIGCNHAEVGAYLVNLWGFPNPVVEALAFHHTPLESVGNSFSPLTAVYAAEVLLQQIEDNTINFDELYLQRIGKESQPSAWTTICDEFLLKTNEKE